MARYSILMVIMIVLFGTFSRECMAMEVTPVVEISLRKGQTLWGMWVKDDSHVSAYKHAGWQWKKFLKETMRVSGFASEEGFKKLTPEKSFFLPALHPLQVHSNTNLPSVLWERDEKHPQIFSLKANTTGMVISLQAANDQAEKPKKSWRRS